MYKKIKKQIIKAKEFYHKKNAFNDKKSIFYHSCEKIGQTNYIREDYLLSLSSGMNVLHFGFLDSPFMLDKIESKSLLHIKLKENAKKVYGIDIDRNALEVYQNKTDDYLNTIIDIQDPNFNKKHKINGYNLILFPEVLEHIINPGMALNNLYELSSLNNNAKVCITVPNAFNLNGFNAAKGGIELVHPDHYYYFSPVTLQKLLKDSGFKELEIIMYSHYLENNNPPGITKNGIIALCSAL